jgi:hypothetical protein
VNIEHFREHTHLPYILRQGFKDPLDVNDVIDVIVLVDVIEHSVNIQ